MAGYYRVDLGRGVVRLFETLDQAEEWACYNYVDHQAIEFCEVG